MSALVEPSRDPSQPLTPHVVTRHRQVGSFSPTASCGPVCCSRAHEVRFHRETRIVPPSPRFEEPSPLSREDGGTTRGAFHRAEPSACLRRSTRRFSHAHPTPRGAGQNQSSCLPCYVRARRLRTVSLGRRALTHHLCGESPAPCGTRLHRPSLPVRIGDGLLPSAPADRAVCDGLARPPAARLAAVRGARTRCVRPTSASHCFDYEYSRRVRSQHLFEACASPLPPELAPWKMETGGPGGSERPIRFGGRSRVGARRLVSRAPDTYRTSDIPVAGPWPRLACATRDPPDRSRPCFAGAP